MPGPQPVEQTKVTDAPRAPSAAPLLSAPREAPDRIFELANVAIKVGSVPRRERLGYVKGASG